MTTAERSIIILHQLQVELDLVARRMALTRAALAEALYTDPSDSPVLQQVLDHARIVAAACGDAQLHGRALVDALSA